MPVKVPYHKPDHVRLLARQPSRGAVVGGESPEARAWARFINSRQWRALSKMHLDDSPYCVHCLRDSKHRPATQVHHTRGRDPEYATDQTTFESCCASCHSSITAHEMQRGKR
jgi:hypothetical protein